MEIFELLLESLLPIGSYLVPQMKMHKASVEDTKKWQKIGMDAIYKKIV